MWIVVLISPVIGSAAMMSESLRSILWNRAPFQSPALFDRLGSSVSSLHELSEGM